MPAAGWAARSGDPVLFVDRDARPGGDAEGAARHTTGVPVYVLGPESAICAEDARRRSSSVAPGAERVGAEDPVENAIAFARYADGSFGWNINDPGHGFVIANADRPLDAAAAAPLSASGTWGPLLVTDDAAAPAGAAARLPARPQARLRRRPDPRRLQPRLADRRHLGALGRPPGAGRRARRGRPGNVRLRTALGRAAAGDARVPARRAAGPETRRRPDR